MKQKRLTRGKKERKTKAEHNNVIFIDKYFENMEKNKEHNCGLGRLKSSDYRIQFEDVKRSEM